MSKLHRVYFTHHPQNHTEHEFIIVPKCTWFVEVIEKLVLAATSSQLCQTIGTIPNSNNYLALFPRPDQLFHWLEFTIIDESKFLGKAHKVGEERVEVRLLVQAEQLVGVGVINMREHSKELNHDFPYTGRKIRLEIMT